MVRIALVRRVGFLFGMFVLSVAMFTFLGLYVAQKTALAAKEKEFERIRTQSLIETHKVTKDIEIGLISALAASNQVNQHNALTNVHYNSRHGLGLVEMLPLNTESKEQMAHFFGVLGEYSLAVSSSVLSSLNRESLNEILGATTIVLTGLDSLVERNERGEKLVNESIFRSEVRDVLNKDAFRNSAVLASAKVLNIRPLTVEEAEVRVLTQFNNKGIKNHRLVGRNNGTYEFELTLRHGERIRVFVCESIGVVVRMERNEVPRVMNITNEIATTNAKRFVLEQGITTLEVFNIAPAGRTVVVYMAPKKDGKFLIENRVKLVMSLDSGNAIFMDASLFYLSKFV
jgi:hypothetical protein